MIDDAQTSPVRADYDHTISLLRTSLSSQAFEETWHIGSSMRVEQSIAYALQYHPI